MKVRVVPDSQQTWLLNKDSQEFGVLRALLSHNYGLTPSTSGYTNVEHFWICVQSAAVSFPRTWSFGEVSHYQPFLPHNFVQVD